MRRSIPHLFWIAGLVLVVIGIIFNPGPPYQDPTPEMRALEARQDRLFALFAGGGLILFASGVIWIGTRWFFRRSFRRGTT